MMLGPVSSEKEGAGSGTGPVRAFSLVIRACWCWCGGVVSAHPSVKGVPATGNISFLIPFYTS